ILGQVHDASYLAFLETAWEEWQALDMPGDALPFVFPARRMQQRVPDHIEGKLGYYAMAMDAAITKGTYDAALGSASLAFSAAKAIADGDRSAFALCRPPGHHAGIDLYGGYCFLNNAAIAAQYLLQRNCMRVAIVDVDFHHGNGTQDIFYARDDVLFVSLHGDPKIAFPHFTGYADETGMEQGAGYTLNLPMGQATPFTEWQENLHIGLKRIEEFAPDALAISLGVDTFGQDPISFFALQEEDYFPMGESLARLRLPSIFVMEGGYAIHKIGKITANVLTGFVQSH
ncbi:MAG: histone deacetylase family protein, partial [Pseudomonadota bacterium]